VEVVRVLDLDGLAGPAGLRVDRGDEVAAAGDGVQRRHVPRRHDVLGLAAGGERVDDLVGGRIDHHRVAGDLVRHVDEEAGAGGVGVAVAGADVPVDVQGRRRGGRGSRRRQRRQRGGCLGGRRGGGGGDRGRCQGGGGGRNRRGDRRFGGDV